MLTRTHIFEAPLETLVGHLETVASDRASGSKSERAADALEAAQRLRDGAQSVVYMRVLHVVADTRDNFTTITGPLPEIVVELDSAADGWRHFGNDKLADVADAARDSLHSGAVTSARVGGFLYSVD